MDSIFTVSGKKCPICGNFSVYDAPISDNADVLFIGSMNTKTNEILPDRGIICNATLRQNCGNIQLQAIRK